jgi:FtsH-binding integral membrane protein
VSSSSGLDIRLPIGGLFTALGLLLSAYGLATAGDASHYARSLSVNINLWWGLVMLVFGLLLLLATRRARRSASGGQPIARAPGS